MASKGQKLMAAGVATTIAEPALALAHTGVPGVIFGLALGAIAYHALDEIEQATGRELPRPAPVTGQREPETPSLVYRLLNGKSTRGAWTGENEDDQAGQPQEEGQGGGWVPPQFMLDDVLDVVHTFNRRGYLYFGESSEGAIALPLNTLYHVFDVCSSRKGKSNRLRLAMMQLVNTCQTYYINPLAASVKAVRDPR